MAVGDFGRNHIPVHMAGVSCPYCVWRVLGRSECVVVLISLWLPIGLALLLASGDAQVCMSTQFGAPGDGYGGRTPTRLTGRPVTSSDVGIAHRDWPIGASIRVGHIASGRTSRAVVIDRGPYGKLDAKGRWFNGARDRKRSGTWRGCADLTPALARRIGHRGRDWIYIRRIGK